jgi:hypothetical protein
MSLFGFLSSKPKRYVSDEAYKGNVAKQVSMTPLTMIQLRKHGVVDTSMLKLEFFFYTNEASKAASLADLLNGRGYAAKCGPSAHKKGIQVINGWTDRMQMSDAVVVAWTKAMCELGFANDCEFDGWGTNPKQSA